MADNIGYTPGTGATIAADDIGGVLHQRVKIGIGSDGTSTDISTANPMPVTETGELVEAIEALRMAVQSLSRSMGQMLPDTANRMRVNIETGTNMTITTLPTLATVTTVGTVTTMSNQTSIGGFIAADYIGSLMNITAKQLRSNISVT
jgi:hypothetical protein